MKFAILIVAAALFGFGSPNATAQSKNDPELTSLIKQLTDAQTAYDAKALDKILAADYIEISPAGEFDPRAKVLGFYTPEAKAAAGNVSTSVEIAEPSIRNYGKFAIVIVRLNFTITAEGKILPPRSMRGTFVMRKQGSVWKIASAQYTGIRPPQAAPPTTKTALLKNPGKTDPFDVRLSVSVTQQKSPVTGLSRDDFQVFEDGVKQELTSFSDEKTNPPAFVGTLMDISLRPPNNLGFLKEASVNFVYTLTKVRTNKAAFGTYDDNVVLRQDFTNKLDLLDHAINKVKKTEAKTAMYDAVWQLADEKLRNVTGRRAIVVISNGDDTLSWATLDDVIELAQKNDIAIFAVTLKESDVVTLNANSIDNTTLRRLCEETGGAVFWPGNMLELEKSFAAILRTLQSQYVISYRSSNSTVGGKFRKVEVRLTDGDKAKEMTIRTKAGYWAL